MNKIWFIYFSFFSETEMGEKWIVWGNEGRKRGLKKKRRRDENKNFVSIRPFSEGDERGWRCIYFLGFWGFFHGCLFVNIVRLGVGVGGDAPCRVMGPIWTNMLYTSFLDIFEFLLFEFGLWCKHFYFSFCIYKNVYLFWSDFFKCSFILYWFFLKKTL